MPLQTPARAGVTSQMQAYSRAHLPEIDPTVAVAGFPSSSYVDIVAAT